MVFYIILLGPVIIEQMSELSFGPNRQNENSINASNKETPQSAQTGGGGKKTTFL